MLMSVDDLKKRVDKRTTASSAPPLVPSFYITPYADSAPGQSTDYSLTCYPSAEIPFDVNFAFFTLNDNKTPGTYGNTIDDTFLTHVRDRAAIQALMKIMQNQKRRIFDSMIDTPNITWDQANVENFVRNTEGEFAPDGTFFTNNLMQNYPGVGRMWDAETSAPNGFAEVMKACFLRGITRDPDNYVFIYTTYADRSIDGLLNMVFDPTKPVDAALIELGFERFTDLFLKRGPGLSWIETMSYSGDAPSRFAEADNYAVKYLANGDVSQLEKMRKYLSIGVAPGLTSPADAQAIGSACDPSKDEGYGRFMVWAGNCPDGVNLFNSMLAARALPLTPLLPKEHSAKEITRTKLPSPSDMRSGNRSRLFNRLAQKAEDEEDAASEPGWLSRMTCGLFNC